MLTCVQPSIYLVDRIRLLLDIYCADHSSAEEKNLDSYLMARPISMPSAIPPEPVVSKEDIELMGSY